MKRAIDTILAVIFGACILSVSTAIGLVVFGAIVWLLDKLYLDPIIVLAAIMAILVVSYVVGTEIINSFRRKS